MMVKYRGKFQIPETEATFASEVDFTHLLARSLFQYLYVFQILFNIIYN
jgi:hypothetical protein